MKKRYWLVVALLGIAALDWYIRLPDPRARELTAAIERQASPQLKAYPYPFRVLRVSGDTAWLSTPRSFEVPAFKVIGSLYPEINTRDNNDPKFIAAEQVLGAVQAEARQIVAAQPGIREVRWELDRDWLRSRYIEVPEKP